MFFFALLIALAAADAAETRQCIVKCARNQFGKPYVWGDEGPNTFDCSGLVMYCYEKCGYNFNGRPTTKTLINMGSSVSRSNLALADLVFPHSGHVQIYSGNGKIIHAPKSGDVVKEVSIYKFWKGRRLISGGTSGGSSDGGSSSGGSSSSTSGRATVTASALNVRSSASSSSSSVAKYYKGESVPYDKIVKNSECTWLSYIASSGKIRYVCGKTASGTCYVSPCP